jgi:N-acetylgalactosamine-6-sulfatase
MNRLALGVALAFACTASAAAPAVAKPNIVLFLADDLGYGDIACYGAPDIRTPHVDGLARQGVRFTSYYSNAPDCTPTRTALLTGRYQHRVGGLECALGIGNVGRYDDAIRLAGQHELGLPANRSVLARGLKEAGYATAICGKWHLGYEPKFLPLRHGFDRFFGILGGNADYFRHVEESALPILYDNDKPVERAGYLTHLFADEAVRFVRERNREQPFFRYLPFTTPHSPYQGPNDSAVKVSEENFNKGTRAKYIEMVEDMDRQIGRVLAALRDQGLEENTLVLFASDNGGTGPGRNAPLSGRKGGLFEGGIRVPLVVRWPGQLKPGTESPQPCLTMDLTASLLRAGGAELTGRTLDGIDILRHVEDGAADIPRRMFWRARRGERTWKAARDGSLKYVRQADGDKVQEWLFDVIADPAEKQDLLARRPDDAARLRKLLVAWESEVRPAR